MYALTYVRAFGVSRLVSFASASGFGILITFLITFSTCNLQPATFNLQPAKYSRQNRCRSMVLFLK